MLRHWKIGLIRSDTHVVIFNSIAGRLNIDAAQIEVAVHGLLTKAIQAIDGDGVVIVRLSECDREDGAGREVVVEVENNGRGIPEEDLSRTFSPFFSTNPNGVGLGLSVVRRIARAGISGLGFKEFIES